MVAKRAIKIRNRTGQWTAEGLLGEIAKTAHADLAGPSSLGMTPAMWDDGVVQFDDPREDEHYRVPGVRVTRLMGCDARERAVATLPVR